MDFLTSIVSAMRLRSALYARFAAAGPWAVQFAAGTERARFGLVTRGECWLTTAALDQPLRLREGDCFLLLSSESFVLGDCPSTPSIRCSELMKDRPLENDNLIRLAGDGGGELTAFVTGWFSFDELASGPLTSLLAPVMLFRAEDERAAALQATLDLLALETTDARPGGELVIRGLADMLFVQAMRAYLASADQARSGIFAALADPRLRRAIDAIHTDMARRWTVSALASVSGMSRSAFADRFHQVLGETPGGYLMQWRMYQAMRLLREGGDPLSRIAEMVGYETQSAFAKAFRSIAKMTPAVYRRTHRNALIKAF